MNGTKKGKSVKLGPHLAKGLKDSSQHFLSNVEVQ